jgi:Na+/H+ antiporter NhaD/arsenite permease-like protein
MTSKRTSWFSMLSGLLALMLCWFFWVPYYGILFTLITSVLAILAIIIGRKIRKQYKQNPETVDELSLKNAKYGVVLGIIGIFISVICFIGAILFTLYFKYLIQ